MMARGGEIYSTVEKPKPSDCLIRSARDRANKWCVVSPEGAAIARDPAYVISSTLSAPARRKPVLYRIAGIDVHKKRLAVVVADVEVEDEYQFERRWYGRNPSSTHKPILGPAAGA